MMTTDLSSYNNNWYRPGSAAKRACWYLVNLLVFKAPFLPFYGLKVFLLRLFGARVGKGVVIKPGVQVKYPWFLQIGNYCWLGEQVWIDNLARVTIGDHVCISQGVLLLCGNHDHGKPGFDLMVKPISLENGVWIGARSVVCPGVHCASHAVLTVGSVATSSLEPFGIYQGNPARLVKKRTISA